MRPRFLALGALSLVLSPAISRAAVIVFTAFLDGPSESPPNASPGAGSATAIYDSVAHTLQLSANFSGLIGLTTAAHIHAPTAVAGTGTAGVATQTPSFVGFPLGVSSGVFNNTLDLTMLSSYNPAFVTANGGTAASAEAALTSFMMQGKSYFNIHSSQFGGGEIRGFLTAVPEAGTSSAVLLLLAAVPFLLLRRRTRSGA